MLDEMDIIRAVKVSEEDEREGKRYSGKEYHHRLLLVSTVDLELGMRPSSTVHLSVGWCPCERVAQRLA